MGNIKLDNLSIDDYLAFHENITSNKRICDDFIIEHTFDINVSKDILIDYLNRSLKDDFKIFAVRLDDVFIGIAMILYNKYPSIGYAIGSRYHNKGYGSKAVELLLAKIDPKYKIVNASVFSTNIASIKVLEHNNFKAKKSEKMHYKGIIHEVILYEKKQP